MSRKSWKTFSVKASFVISAEERATAKKALLWADYIDDSNGKSHYNTDDLLAVTYSEASLTYDMSKIEPHVVRRVSAARSTLSTETSASR